ncbi:enoyl-CoA hydratase/isomerase family protein [Polyangium aurulentum]|uniref:enoyl-CoA hydratase/isomerase family protein n=1 Tax=Polyangium aurulentum TaxID=2567896 RepID=UPI0010AE692E|nr:enoyl-CoA hydratase/isomerase family protein [Polyangium aurulentum]UQA55484.1 enoyl-CoA hydratase/isomerase family protein [Polyangium aurulentum]
MPEVHVEREGAVVTLILDDARRKNAMSPELGDALAARVHALKDDRSVRAVVLTGAGDAFSAGGDLAMLERLRSVSFAEARAFMSGFYQRYLSITELGVPVVAAVRGAAIGAGLCVALACDLLVLDENSRLALNFVQLGLHPGMGATYLVPRRVGAQRAAELLLTGRRFTGREAAAWGMALEALPADGVLARAGELAAQIAAQAPLAVRALKADLGLDRSALASALDREAHEQAVSYASTDLGEGLRAASERRAPAFTGH